MSTQWMCDFKSVATLIKKSAEAMDNEDRRRIAAGESTWKPVAGSPTVKGQELCQQLAEDAGVAPLGFLVYLLLAYTWNDALDWADRIKSRINLSTS
jgi:hypothetical protein